MITIEPFFPAEGGRASDPVLMGVTRGLSQVLPPLEPHELPENLAELVRRLGEGDEAREG